jgi:hypothetical protein
MIYKYFHRFGSLVLAALMLPGITLLTSTSATGQTSRQVIIVRRPYRPFWGWRYRDPFWRADEMRYSRYVFSNSNKAYDRGYKDGLKVGRGDIKNGRSYDPQRSHYYQEAGFGNFGEVYRAGFDRGYADGFRV